MYSSTRNKSNVPPLSTCHRSPPSVSPSTFASSTSSSFSSTTRSSFFARAISPTRANRHVTNTNSTRSSSSVRFSIDRPISPGRSISFSRQSSTTITNAALSSNKKRTCACSPTTHPGSFRCALHKGLTAGNPHHHHHQHHRNQTQTVSYHSSSRLNCRRSAMTNSLVRIGGVEGELVKRALTALIRPSSHQQRRRAAFEPRPSRLSKMSKS